MTDSIKKVVEIAAPVERVWRALADYREFGSWFGVALETPFIVGQVSRGYITNPGYENLLMEMLITRLDPPRVLEYTWHPYAVETGVDYSAEEPTLVVFTLEPTPSGTRLTLVESGFDRLPAHRRADAVRMNDGGWEHQMGAIREHVEG